MLTTAAVLTACSNEELVPVVHSDDVQITLNSTTIEASGAATRAPFEGAIGIANKLKARVIASRNSSFTGSAHANGTMTFAGSAAGYDAGATGTTTYPTTGAVYVFGLYPDAGWTYNAGKADFTFTGKEDVMATSQVETTATDVAPGGTYQTLSFGHLLTKLEVKMNATAAAIAEFGNITAIRLVDVQNKVSVDNTGTTMATPIFSGSIDLNFYGLSVSADNAKVYSSSAISNVSLTNDSKPVAYAMVAPVTASATPNAGEYVLEIVTSKGPKTVDIDLKTADGSAFSGTTAGYAFGISLYFKSINEIMADVKVDDWISEGEFQGEITNE